MCVLRVRAVLKVLGLGDVETIRVRRYFFLTEKFLPVLPGRLSCQFKLAFWFDLRFSKTQILQTLPWTKILVAQ